MQAFATLRSMARVGAVLAVLIATPAEGQDSSKLYAGVGLAVMDVKSDHGGIAYADTAAGWQLYGGYQASDFVAIELAGERFSAIDPGELLGSGIERLRIAAELRSLTVRGVFSLSLEEVLRRRRKITVFGTLGTARATEERSVTELTTARQSEATEHENGLVIGVGAAFGLPRVRLRAHLQSLDRAGPSLISAGVAAEFRF